MMGKLLLPLLVFLFCSVLVFASLGFGIEDPELEQCKHQCKVQQQYGRREKQECVERCEKYYKEKQEREGKGRDVEGDQEELLNPAKRRDPEEEQFRRCKEGCERAREGGPEVQRRCTERCEREYRQHQHQGREEERGGGGGGVEEENKDPEEQFRHCKEQCQRQREGQEQQRCHERCRKEYEEKRRRGEGNPRHEEERREEREESEGQQERTPYVFDDQHFTTKVETQHGRVQILQNFRERSKLLRGIENYRVTVLEADPQTFVAPSHMDAEAIIFVAKGKGTISLVRHDKRESFNLNSGDVLRVPAGVTVYLINRSNNQQLVLYNLLQPVSTPGHFEAFSTELLEAALNTRRDRIQKIFGQQRQGVIIKASQEQIRAMSRHEEGGIWPFSEKSKGPFNLFHKRSSLSNQYGQLYEVDSNDCSSLEELDLGVGFANISEGAMIAPYYNSKATKIAIVTNGEGFMEMACPHLASPEFAGEGGRQHGGGGRTSQRYHKVRAQLRRGMVFVVPAGHPVITVASNYENLEILCFDINARNNEKFLLAGRRNIISQMEKEAKELGFGVPAKDVDEVFKSQEEEFFLQGPRKQRHHEGRAEA